MAGIVVAWVTGLVVMGLVGHFFVEGLLQWLRDLAGLRDKNGGGVPAWATGLVERIFFASLVALNVFGYPTAMMAYLAAKLAANWSHPKREGVDRHKWAVSALLAGLASMLVAVFGGLLIQWLSTRLAWPPASEMGTVAAAGAGFNWSLFYGLVLGIVASGIVVIWHDFLTKPLLQIFVDDEIALGQVDNAPPHAFYHLKVRQRPVMWPLASRRSAWSAKATIEVLNMDGTRAIVDPKPIPARWPSKRQPLMSHLLDGQLVHMFDVGLMSEAAKVDIHYHVEDEKIALLLKLDRQSECYIFSNESYLYGAWSKPEWRLNTGEYRVRVTVYYERRVSRKDFLLKNLGTARDSVQIMPA